MANIKVKNHKAGRNKEIRKVFRLVYFHGKNPFLHHQRDEAIFIELMQPLSERGYEFGGALFNLYSLNGTKGSPSILLNPKKGDIIVMTTRPPLDDAEEGRKHVIKRGDTDLEEKVLRALREYLPTCSRREVVLNPCYVDMFEKGYDDRCSITFTGNGKKKRYLNVARYQVTVNKMRKIRQWLPKDGCRTAGYLIYVREAWKGGPDILACFGITGSCGLIWAYRIRTSFPYLLDSPRIVMAEIMVGPIPNHPLDMSFADAWVIKVPLNHRLS